MFTGQRAFDGPSDRSTPPSASSAAKDIDPGVEKVIRRCLDPNPEQRPASALDVARALPGGDPLAEALAAGDTPSPEMVAASEDTGALSIRAAIACLVIIAVTLIGVILTTDQTQILRMTPAPKSAEVLAQEAREIAVQLGYTDLPADSAYSFSYRDDLNAWARNNLNPEEYRAMISRGNLAPLLFWYRQSPRDLITTNAIAVVTSDDPPLTVSGMVRVDLDMEGRLLGLSAVPAAGEDAPSRAGPVDWQPLFDAAGLDQTEWAPTIPQFIPLTGFNEQAAWTGSYEPESSVPMRIEAAAWNGRPVHFEISGPWRTAERVRVQQGTAVRVANGIVVVFATVLSGAVLLAWRNYRRSRGDLRGASRLAMFAFGFQLCRGLLTRIFHR